MSEIFEGTLPLKFPLKYRKTLNVTYLKVNIFLMIFGSTEIYIQTFYYENYY